MAVNHCPPLPAASGRIVEVSSEQELFNAVQENIPDTTILIKDGTYHLGQSGYYLWLDTPNVVLRSKSGNREAVVLDDNYTGTETITIAASNVTVADLTIQRARTHPIHIIGTDGAHTLNTLIYNVHVIDPGQQGIKINPNAARTRFPDDGEIACSHIELTDTGRQKVLDFNGGTCYTGGIDGHWARGWEIRDNQIEGFWCSQGLSEHAVHFWTGSRDTRVQRNRLFNNARGVGFGLNSSGTGRTYPDDPCPSSSGYVDHFDGLIRNNWVYANQAALFASDSGFDCGICLWQACEAQVVHNTVVSLQAPFSSIEWRFANTQVELLNNLVSHNLRERDGAAAVLEGNLTDAPQAIFLDAGSGDLHLRSNASAAIDMGADISQGLAWDDIDGEARPSGAGRDIGADEYVDVIITYTDFVWLPLIWR